MSSEKSWLDYLLEQFDTDRDKAAAEYLRVLRRLSQWFENAGHNDPDELAERTLMRVGEKLAKGETEVSHIKAFVMGFAKNISREARKEYWGKFLQSLDDDEADFELPQPNQQLADEQLIAEEWRSLQIKCLRHCLDQLKPDDKLFYTSYVMQDLAPEEQQELLGYTIDAFRYEIGPKTTAVRKRKSRIENEQIKPCVTECMAEYYQKEKNS